MVNKNTNYINFMIMENIEKNLYHDHNYDDDDVLKEYDIMKKYKSHNILNERVKLYEDFSINLLYKIYDTYLGKEYINNKKDAEGHYNWCFGKVLEEFYEQEISFYENEELYNYFFDFYLDRLYKNETPKNQKFWEKFFKEVFNNTKPKKLKREFDLFVEMYDIFDISINEKNRILEKK